MKLLIFFLFFFCTFSQSIHLQGSGFHLVSPGANNQIESLFASYEAISVLWGRKDDAWQVLVPSSEKLNQYTTISAFVDGNGYWVKTTAPVDLNISYEAPLTSFANLIPTTNWVLLGTDHSVIVSTELDPILKNGAEVWAYQNFLWSVYTKGDLNTTNSYNHIHQTTYADLRQIPAGSGFFISPPLPKMPVLLSVLPEDSRVSLSWQAQSDALSYSVYFSDLSSAFTVKDSWSYIQRGLTQTSFQMPGLINKKTYYFAITATNLKGEGPAVLVSATPDSDFVSSRCQVSLRSFPILTNSISLYLQTGAGANEFEMSWNPVKNASSYAININLPDHKSYFPDQITNRYALRNQVIYDQTTHLTFAGSEWRSDFVEQGKRWEITLSAKDSSGTTIFSDIQSIRVGTPRLEAPADVWIRPESGGLHCFWCEVAGASSYRLFYSKDPSFSFYQSVVSASPDYKLTTDSETYIKVQALGTDLDGYESFSLKAKPLQNPLVDLEIESVTLNQGVQIDLTSGISSVPAIAGKTGILRIFLKSVGEVEGIAGRMKITAMKDGAEISSLHPSYSFQTTLKQETEQGSLPVWISLPSSWTQTGVEFFIEIDDQNQILETNENNNRFPTTGNRSFGFVFVPDLRIRLVPIKTPFGLFEPTQDMVNKIQIYLQAIYPNHRVQIELRSWDLAKLEYNISENNGWDVALKNFDTFRTSEISSAERDIFYYGIFKHMSDEDWETTGGTSGLGYKNDDLKNTPWLSAIGVGFENSYLETIAHEMGHNHGRSHVDNVDEFNDFCQRPDDNDVNYPYNSAGASYARIATVGYDNRTHTLYNPVNWHDIMSYCATNWISEYTYKAIHEFQIHWRNQMLTSPSLQKVEGVFYKGIVSKTQIESGFLFSSSQIPSTFGQGSAVVEFEDGEILRLPVQVQPMDHLPVSSYSLFIPKIKNILHLSLFVDGKNQQISSSSRSVLRVSDDPSVIWDEGNKKLILRANGKKRFARLCNSECRVVLMDDGIKDREIFLADQEILHYEESDGLNLYRRSYPDNTQ